MYSLDIVIGTAVCVLIVAGFVGFLMGRRSSAGSQQARELEQRLEQVTRDKQHFEDRVTEHFVETATRLNALTENYRAVHEHLAEGASTLCSGDVPVKLARLGAEGDVDANLLNVEAPRDYAPKSSPTEKGMLNEGFGLDKDDAPPTEKSRREEQSAAFADDMDDATDVPTEEDHSVKQADSADEGEQPPAAEAPEDDTRKVQTVTGETLTEGGEAPEDTDTAQATADAQDEDARKDQKSGA